MYIKDAGLPEVSFNKLAEQANRHTPFLELWPRQLYDPAVMTCFLAPCSL